MRLWSPPLGAAAFAWIMISGAPPARAGDACADIMPPPLSRVGPARPVTSEDLVGLRDVGLPGLYGLIGDDALALSPDGTKLAFQLRRADTARNDYCLAMVVLDLAAGARATYVDRGGTLIRQQFDLEVAVGYPTGVPKTITPRWSPDGQSIAFLKKKGDGYTQIWGARADGGGARVLTAIDTDVDSLAWSPDGTAILFVTRPGLIQAEHRIDAEALTGFQYDDRSYPKSRVRPYPPGPIAARHFRLVLATGAITPAPDDERPDPRLAPIGSSKAELVAISAQGSPAWTSPVEPDRIDSATVLNARLDSQRTVTCAAPACDRIRKLWWAPNGRSIWYMRTEGWAHEALAFYRWIPGRSVPRRLMVTHDWYTSCLPHGNALICAQETATQPRRIVRLSPESGKIEPLFDPNPEWAMLSVAPARRLFWRNNLGSEIFGDLVLPANRQADTPLPTILVQYESYGFLRGGTGDEYPIQALAAHGFAVLSVQRPPDFADRFHPTSYADAERLNLRGFADRKNVLSALQDGVDELVRRGITDPVRVGLTGLSDGARTTWYALVNSRTFAAAAVSSCCEDPGTLLPLAGPALARRYVSWGFPQAGREDPAFWRYYALSVNGARVTAPLLMQLSDDEYQASLEALAALEAARRPVDLFVFPGEHHVKFQPDHRLAVYRRNIAWFDFWLQGREDPDLVADDELTRWRKFRETARAPAAATMPNPASSRAAPSTRGPRPRHPPVGGSADSRVRAEDPPN